VLFVDSFRNVQSLLSQENNSAVVVRPSAGAVRVNVHTWVAQNKFIVIWGGGGGGVRCFFS